MTEIIAVIWRGRIARAGFHRLIAAEVGLANYGWAAVNWVVFRPVALGVTVLLFASLMRRRVALP
jgi:hypothetical protein